MNRLDKWLFLPPGVTQLLNLIAAHRTACGANETKDGKVLSLCYYFNQEMANALREAAACFQLKYIGNMEPTSFRGFKISAKNLFRGFIFMLFPKWKVRRTLAYHGFPQGLEAQAIASCIRPWVYDEVLIDSFLQPGTRLYALDGINPSSPERNLDGLEWRGIKTPFNRLPMKEEVFFQPGLEAEATQIGIPRPIDPEILASVYAEYRQTELGSAFEQFLKDNSSTDGTVIVFSQQLNLCGYCSADAEIAYYLTILKSFSRHGFKRLLFKPHPRDAMEKINAIKMHCAADEAVTVIPNQFLPIPFEPFADLLRNCTQYAVSTNSTALVTYRALTGHSCISLDFKDFTEAFRSDLKTFCGKHAIKSILAEEW